METKRVYLKNQKNILARAVGRRKEATAQVILCQGTGEFIINNKPAIMYLQNNSCSIGAIKAPFDVFQNMENNIENQISQDQIDTIVKVEGGGLIGQAEAIKLAVARAVCLLAQTTDDSFDILLKKSLKDKGFLTIDARVKERRKYGLKKARKASQYHKR
jgi:small subunit ribosomal protein S9